MLLDKDEAMIASLTETEKQVFRMIIIGMSVNDIVKQRRVVESTVRYQIKQILQKFGVHSQAQALAIYHAYHLRKLQKDLMSESFTPAAFVPTHYMH